MKVLTLLAVLIPLVTLTVSAWRINKVYKVRTTARLSRGMEELFQRPGSQYIRSCNLPVFSSSSVLDCQAKCSFYRAEGGALTINIMIINISLRQVRQPRIVTSSASTSSFVNVNWTDVLMTVTSPLQPLVQAGSLTSWRRTRVLENHSPSEEVTTPTTPPVMVGMRLTMPTEALRYFHTLTSNTYDFNKFWDLFLFFSFLFVEGQWHHRLQNNSV